MTTQEIDELRKEVQELKDKFFNLDIATNHRQIKIDGVYYTASRADADLLQQMEGDIFGSCTPEGIAAFRAAIKEVKSRALERNWEFETYSTE